MRRNQLKLLVTCILLGVILLTTSFWGTKCTDSDINKQDNNFYREEHEEYFGHGIERVDTRGMRAILRSYEEIPCSINEEYTVSCRRERNDVFIPFSFIRKYFEVSGNVAKSEDGDVFEWHHSYSSVYRPERRYTPEGTFLSFDHYNVEVRDRVKCIDGMNGVPVSTQWGAHGYHYPIQIAQFGLSHYSKYKSTGDPHTAVVDDGENLDLSLWSVPKGATLKSVIASSSASGVNKQIIEFSCVATLNVDGIRLEMPKGVSKNVLSFDVKFFGNSSISAVFESHAGKEYYLHYITSSNLLISNDDHIFYGLGHSLKWRTITRDLYVDLQKGFAARKSKKTFSFQDVRTLIKKLVRIEIRGEGWIDNIAVSKTAHLAHFFDAADWLLGNQDKNGGWPIDVVRKLLEEIPDLQPGWYSAMGQGQAISLLVRAYVKTDNPKYLESAKGATELFNIPSEKGGIYATFMGKYGWYEEYPTIPSSFVLNGFMYSLFGLYDLMMIAPEYEEARQLYMTGMESLKSMLLLYDTGSGSVYDLRHQQVGTAPNVARWDYHTTHINQLLFLGTIDDSPLWNQTAERWIGYANGHRAPHN